jgi:Ca2+-binding EF-hand superfamily protein
MADPMIKPAWRAAAMAALLVSLASPALARQQSPAQVFAQLDRNRDGKVTLSEARALRDVRIAGIDRNGDGKISREEFVNFPPDRPGVPTPATILARRGKVFATVDTNGDGVIDANEREDSLRKWFKRFDLNRDGHLTAKEYAAARAGARPGRRPAAAAGRNFRMIDANGDGAISLAELQSARAKQLLGSDRDRDGRISRNEFVAFAPGTRPTAAAARLARRRAALFASLDANGDGYITRAELDAALKTLFLRLDANRNGRITPDELAMARARGRRPAR